MQLEEDEERLLRSVALQNAKAILRAQERAEQELLLANRQITNILESITDGFIILDREFRYVYMNGRAEDHLQREGRTKAEVMGRSIFGFLPDPGESEIEIQFRRALREQVTVHFPTYRPDTGLWLDIRAYPSADGLSVYFQDITEQVRVQQELREEKRLLELLNDTGAAISANLDVKSLVQTVTDSATKMTGAEFGAFFYNVVNADGEAFQLYTLSGAPPEAFASFGHPRATALFGPTFRGEGVIRSGDVLKDPRYGQWAPHHGMPRGHLPVRSYLAVPVISRGGDVIGGLFFGHKEPDVFSVRSERLVIGVAAQAAVAIDNARLFEAAQLEIGERARVEHALRTAQEALSHHAEDLESQVAARTASLREALAQLEEFSYTVSHDLRAPIRAIGGYARIFEEDHGDALDPDAKWLLSRIQGSADMMARLVDDILQLSRTASLKVDLHPVALDAFVRHLLAQHPAMQQPAARIVVLAPHSVVADDALLSQALTNLLSNAVKFVRAGVMAEVTVRSERHGDRVRIWVEDNGVGIRPEHLDKLFGMFQRLPATEGYEGTGIGLALVRKAVERMEGTVGVQPAETGSRFWMELGGTS